MAEVLVDSNVILDVLTEDAKWLEWSASNLAEVSVRFESIEEVEDALAESYFRRDPLPWEAAFLAGKCFLRYRRRGGRRGSPLPDFYIGAHAAVRGMKLLTRDTRRYRTSFPRLELISPEKSRSANKNE
ncbi:MAG: DNA-binding protein [Acidobacteria bacterium]|nr:MAG: DNA-binding protein [Acidobacteriota bacterium]